VIEAGPTLVFWVLATLMVVGASCFVLPFVGGRATAAVVAIGMPAGAFALYALLGDPGATGDARAALSQQVLAAGSSSDPMPQAQAYAELERHLSRQPADARALVLKARIDMQAQRFELAAAAYQKALRGPSKVAGDATVWVEYAEARGLLQGGTLTGEPQRLVEKALSLDATNRQALDLAGSAAWEQRDFAAASRYWKRLLAQVSADSVRHAELSAAIARADERARFALPAAR
jgi:cytochrome c-type biogenesis protein CcmH